MAHGAHDCTDRFTSRPPSICWANRSIAALPRDAVPLTAESGERSTLLPQHCQALTTQREQRLENALDADPVSRSRRPVALTHHGERPGVVLHLIGAQSERTGRLLHSSLDLYRLPVVAPRIIEELTDRCDTRTPSEQRQRRDERQGRHQAAETTRGS